MNWSLDQDSRVFCLEPSDGAVAAMRRTVISMIQRRASPRGEDAWRLRARQSIEGLNAALSFTDAEDLGAVNVQGAMQAQAPSRGYSCATRKGAPGRGGSVGWILARA